VKTTQKNLHAFVRRQLGSSPAWALKALVRIFQENQTPDEQQAEIVKHHNDTGFTGADGQFLSSLAKQYIARGSLSEKQMTYVFRKMPKYHNQVIGMSDPVKLELLVRQAS
jgi:hypothetical protein